LVAGTFFCATHIVAGTPSSSAKEAKAGECKDPPTPSADPQTGKTFISADPLAVINRALPKDWQVRSDSWSDAAYTIVLQDKSRPGDRHAVLGILPPRAKERPGGGEIPGKTLASILKAANGEVFLWADAGGWTTIDQDLAKALAGEPMRVEEFVAEYRAPRDWYKDIVRDAGGAIMEARIQPNWLQLLRFHMTQEKFERACRKALAERAVADIRDVWVDTGSHRDMHLADMGQVWTQVGRQWPDAETPLDQATGHAASVLRATDGSRAEVYERGRMHMSTVGEHGRGGGFLTEVRCRQSFKVVEALRGQPVAGRRAVQYRFIEESHCFPGPKAEQAVPANTDVILLLDEKGGLVKALPDTEEERKAVKTAMEKVQGKPAMEKVQGKPAPGKPNDGAAQTRIPRLIADLPDYSQREAAIAELAKIGEPAVEALIEALRGEDLRLYDPAAEALGKIGPKAVEAIPALIRSIRDHEERQGRLRGEELSHWRRFVTAEQALLRIGIHTRPAVPYLATLAEDEDYYVRMRAMVALRQIGPDAQTAVQALVRQLFSKDETTRGLAADALGSIGRGAGDAAPALGKALSGASNNYDRIGNALARIGKPAVASLKTALGDKDEWARAVAAEALGKIGPDARDAVPELAAALGDPSLRVRHHAAVALGKIGPEAKPVVPALTKALRDADDVAICAALALVQIDPAAIETAVPALIGALERGMDSRSAAEALARLGPAAKRAVPSLRRALEEGAADARKFAAVALGCIGPDAAQATDALVKRLKDDYVDARVAAARALVQIDPANRNLAVPVLVASLADEKAFVREVVPDQLARMGKPAVPALIEALKSENPRVRCEVLRVLGKIGAEANESLPAVLRALKDEPWSVRAAAASALATMGPEAKRAVPELVKMLDDRYTRAGATAALARLDPAALEGKMAIFIKALQGGDWWSRCDAANALGLMGPAARPALPALQETLFDLDESVRSAAAEALKRVRAEQGAGKPLERLSPRLRVRYAQGRLCVNLAGSSEGLAVTWPLPKEIRGPLRESIDPNKQFPEVLLYRGNDMEKYLAPGGAARMPRPHETAVAGILECEPGTKDKTVKMTLRDLRFQTVTVPQIGPFDVELDNPPAP
jgi:HEAT repeat protein